MLTNRLDDEYVSELGEREDSCYPFPIDLGLGRLLSTSTFRKSDFRGPKLLYTDRTSAVDVVRSATNMFNNKVCRLARLIESHVDLNSECQAHGRILPAAAESPRSDSTTSLRSRRRQQSRSEIVKSHATPIARADTFDDIVEAYLNTIANTLTVIIERGNNTILDDAVEAVVAHLSFVDTVKLSLLRPLLTTYPTCKQVHLQSTADGVRSSFKCLMGHEVRPVLLFSNMSVVSALESIITAPCLTRIFYCYWSCLVQNLDQFKQEISGARALESTRRLEYGRMLGVASSHAALQEARLGLDRYLNPSSWPDFLLDGVSSSSMPMDDVSSGSLISSDEPASLAGSSWSKASSPVDTSEAEERPIYRYISQSVASRQVRKLLVDGEQVSGKPVDKPAAVQTRWSTLIQPVRHGFRLSPV